MINSKKIAELTNRENQVIKLIAKGYSNPQIAKEMDISKYTAKAHVCKMMDKLNAVNRIELVVLAIKNGLLEI